MSLSDVRAFRRGQVVLVEYPFVEAAGSKLRPAILLTDTTKASGPDGHFIFAGTRPPPPGALTVDIPRGSPEATAMGLKFDADRRTCHVHATRIATLRVSLVRGRLGITPPHVVDRIAAILGEQLGLRAA